MFSRMILRLCRCISFCFIFSVWRLRFGGRIRECKVYYWRSNIIEVYCKESFRDRIVDLEWIWYGER